MNSALVAKALWTAEDAAAATGGRLVGPDSWIAAGVSIDTRSLEPGDLFVALRGERDGHDFLVDAFSRGAAAALVSDPDAAKHGPALVVPDTLEGLRGLARAARARTAARCVAVTGSVGKTSVKELAAAALAPSGVTHHAVKSFNNHIGVPLTLARTPADASFAVFEIGMNHRHEIAPLVALVRPHVAIVTWIAPAHIENLGSLEAIADEKSDIYSALEPGGAAIVPMDAPQADRLLAAAERCAARVVRLGKGAECEARLIAATPTREGQILEAELFGAKLTTPLSAPGPHFAHNALIALTASVLAGGDLGKAEEAVASAGAAAGRGAALRVETDFGAFTLVDDAYNANPASVAAALATLAQRAPGPGGRRIAALGDMLELGDHAPTMHAGLAAPIASAGVDLVYCSGPLMASLWGALPEPIRGGYADNADALVPLLAGALRDGDVVLVKGSNGSRMGRVVDALSRLGARPRGT